MRNEKRFKAASIAATLLLLAAFTVDQFFYRVPTADAAPYHAAVQQAATRIPLHIGSWLGEDIPVPPAATKLLKPNVIVSRRYTDLTTGRRFDFLLVQCTDTRDMLGHYPPVCYVGQGWTMQAQEPRDWDVGQLPIKGMDYSFHRTTHRLPARLTVYNFIILPDGQICRAMEEADAAAQDLRRKFLGAAQVQLVFDGSMPQDARDEVLELIIDANQDVLQTIRRGVQHDK